MRLGRLALAAVAALTAIRVAGLAWSARAKERNSLQGFWAGVRRCEQLPRPWARRRSAAVSATERENIGVCRRFDDLLPSCCSTT